jgi:anti-anti-sigma factor
MSAPFDVASGMENPFGSQDLILVHDVVGAAHVVHVLCEVDICNAGEFAAELAELPSTGPVVVDLEECRFMDSTALSVLLDACALHGERVSFVVRPSSMIERLLRLFDVHAKYRVTHSLPGAVGSTCVPFQRNLIKPRFREA